MLRITLLFLAFICTSTIDGKKNLKLNDENSNLWNSTVKRVESRTVSCSQKPRTVTLNRGDEVQFRSPGYPSKSSSKAKCGWRFRASSKSDSITVTCPEFSIKPVRKGFCKDYVSLGGKIYCGDNGPEGVQKAKKANIWFRSNTKKQYEGFSCTASVPTKTENKGKCECGKSNSFKKIVGGKETEVNEYPWQVALVDSGSDWVWCGGALINSRWVLTAAHCTQSGVSQVLLGKHYFDAEDNNSKVKRLHVVRIVDHPNFDSKSLNFDFSLLRLESSLDLDNLSPEIRPVCLPPVSSGDPDLYDKVNVVVSGWGTTSAGGPQPAELQEVSVVTMSNSKCNTNYGGEILSSMICAASPDKDSCQGDSGGPMVWKSGTYYELIGVVSWGYGCADPRYPGVYARVTSALKWINRISKDGQSCPPPS